jgi:NTP pyrophosphatase (non-canonical NTP hydrolase)
MENTVTNPTSEVTSNNYVKLAIRTESPSLEPTKLTGAQVVRVRLLALQLQIVGAILNTLKRQIFYRDPKSDAVKHFDMAYDPEILSEVQRAAVDIILSPDDTRLLHGLLGKTTELAELWESLGQYLIVRPDGAPITKLDVVNLIEEQGDGLWYDAVILDTLQRNLDQVLTANIAKLQKRYPDKFSTEAAVNRDLIVERETLAASVVPPVAASVAGNCPEHPGGHPLQ